MLSLQSARFVELTDTGRVHVLGQGTWRMGEDPRNHDAEIASLRMGIELGFNLVDTAELYGGGTTERLVGEAIEGLRSKVFLVSKVLPHHATVRGTISACKESLRRLRVDELDMYLLHWRGRVPLSQTVQAFEQLRSDGLIRSWGVSNFSVEDMGDLWSAGGERCAANQILYNLCRRGVEFDLLPWCERNKVAVMAYSPIEQGSLVKHPVVNRIAHSHGATAAQVALAWVLRQPGMISIPKAGNPAHLRENAKALDVHLSSSDLETLDIVFARPTRKTKLEMI